MSRRRCATCQRITTHAYLRDGDPDLAYFTAYIETPRLPPRLSEEDENWLLRLDLEQLVECGVGVQRFEVEQEPAPDGRVTVLWVTESLTDGTWVVMINASESSALLRRALARFWSLAFATDRVPCTVEQLDGETPHRAWAVSWLPSGQHA